MISSVKDWIKQHWPQLQLRTILFATLFVVAALPGAAAMFLRVYENTLVRQTEAELTAQGAALSATAAALWPGAILAAADPRAIRPEPPTIDLSTTRFLPDRPAPAGPGATLAGDAIAASAQLYPIIVRTHQTTLAGVALLDRHGLIVGGPATGLSYAALPEVRDALAGRVATVLRRNASYRATYRFEWLSRAAAIRVHQARPIVVGGRVVGVLLLSRSARGLFRGVYEDRGKIVLGVVAILALLIVLSGLLSRGITRPIEQLGAATRGVAQGQGRIPDMPKTAAVEIQGLYADFAAMAAAIERRSRYLRDFAHAVSHEFKTPLTGIRGSLELLRDHADMDVATRNRFLSNADADAERLSLLVTRLLDLARADMAAPDGEVSAPGPVIARVADAWRGAGLAVDLQLPAALPQVTTPAATLENVFAILLENSRQAGAQHVGVTATPSTTSLVLRVDNDGPGIAAGDRARLFEPFFTTRRADGGSGLGLAIARSLLTAAGGGIVLAESEHTVFEVTLPLASHHADDP